MYLYDYKNIINWKYYGDNNNIFYESKPLKQRFIEPVYSPKKYKKKKYIYAAAKSIIRGGLNITWKHFPHFLQKTIICRPNGKIIKNPLSSPDYSFAYIKHYATKSTEEFADKLLKGEVNIKNSLSKSYWRDKINNYYFLFNKKNKEKIDLFEKKLKINLK